MAKAKNSRHLSGNPAKRGTTKAPPPKPVTFGDWVGAARLRTLPLAVTPVLIGTGAAVLADVDREFHWVIALFCLAVAVLLQVGVNVANDYSDGVRGTDDFRVGPARLTASGRVPARTVLVVALTFFALAALAGLAIVIRTQQWWMLAVGAVCIVAAWFYTGGKRPYGYHALGEVFVFVFFGLVATLGTTWVQALYLPQEAWFGAVAAGFLAVAVLLANNLRDIDQDRAAGKRTLSVVVGALVTKILYTVLVAAAYVIAGYIALFYPIAWLSFFSLVPLGPAIVIVWSYKTPRELVTALALTSIASPIYGFFFAWSLIG